MPHVGQWVFEAPCLCVCARADMCLYRLLKLSVCIQDQYEEFQDSLKYCTLCSDKLHRSLSE